MKRYESKSKSWLHYEMNRSKTLMATEYTNKDVDTLKEETHFVVTEVRGSDPNTADYITLLNTKDFEKFKNYVKTLVEDKVFKEYWDKDVFANALFD